VKPKVLVVDDEEFFRKIVALGFEKEGFSIVQADNGVDAIRLAREEIPDLIILDLVMPGLLGFEVCMAVRQDDRFEKTAIIIMSAKSYKPDIEKAKELGADAYLVKPVEFEEILRISREQMKKRANLV